MFVIYINKVHMFVICVTSCNFSKFSRKLAALVATNCLIDKFLSMRLSVYLGFTRVTRLIYFFSVLKSTSLEVMWLGQYNR